MGRRGATNPEPAQGSQRPGLRGPGAEVLRLIGYPVVRQVLADLGRQSRFFNQGEGIHTENIDHVQIITKVHRKYVQMSQHSNSYHKPFWKIVEKLTKKYKQNPGVEKWNYFVLEPQYTAANLHEKSLFGEEE